MAANRVMGVTEPTEPWGPFRARVSVSRVSSMSSVWSHTHQVKSPKNSSCSKIAVYRVLNEFLFTQKNIKVQMSSQSWYGILSHFIQVRGRWWLCLNTVFSHQMARMFLSGGPESLKHGNPNLQLMDMTFGAGGHTDVILNHQLADRVGRLVVCDCDR